MKVILDCDNTMGVKKSDVDDGLTFAYLYAHPEVELIGITCTFANNYEHIVYYNTIQMLEDLNIKDVPVLKGGRTPQAYDSEAVDFLIKQVNEYPQEITILAIGSLCNIAGAYQKDPLFFHKIKRIIAMGGILEPLYLNGVLCNELNFSIDPNSAANVLYCCEKLSVLTSQCTQEAVYSLADLESLFETNTVFMNWSKPILEDWIKRKTKDYGNRSVFINWDLCAAIYLSNPELFSTSHKRVVKIVEHMKTGYIEVDDHNRYPDELVNLVDIPDKILDIQAFNELFYKMISKME